MARRRKSKGEKVEEKNPEFEKRWNFTDLRYDQVLKGSMYRQEHMPLAPKFSQISLGGLGGRREVSPFEV